MFSVSYEWKVDFAIILSILSVITTIALWLFERKANRKNACVQAYEQVYDDACYILEFPLHKNDREAKNIQYANTDPELEQAVRAFLNSHWMDQYWGTKKFVPPSLTAEDKKREFMRKVSSEAYAFRAMLSSHTFNLTIREMSPVFHTHEEEISERLVHIMKYVGKNLSLFSPVVRQQWGNARFADPLEIRREYEKALEVCDHYFEHNTRDFDDPFYDLLTSIRKEYRQFTRDRRESIKWIFDRRLLKLKAAVARLGIRKKERSRNWLSPSDRI